MIVKPFYSGYFGGLTDRAKRLLSCFLITLLAFVLCNLTGLSGLKLARAEGTPPMLAPLIQMPRDSSYWGPGHLYGPGFGALDGGPKAKYGWCTVIGLEQPDYSAENTFTLKNMAEVTGHFAGPEYALSKAQTAWIINKYADIATDTSRAAIAFLVHANFESKPTNGHLPAEKVTFVKNWFSRNRPDVLSTAKKYVSAAKQYGWASYESLSNIGEKKTNGTISGIGVKNDAGKFVSGYSLTVTLDGPALFTKNQAKSIKLTSASKPLSLAWEANGNGTVTPKVTYEVPKNLFSTISSTDRQDTVFAPLAKPTETIKYPAFKVSYDFQPMATSQVASATVALDTNELTDQLTVSVDPDKGAGEWLEEIPVKFEAEVYYLGEKLPTAPASSVPEEAKLATRTSITATKPGNYSATVKTDKPGFYTWVWKVVKSHQGKFSKRIHGDWSDGYTVKSETQSRRTEGKITTANNVISTHAGSDAKSFLNDWINISGFPANHGNFKGYGKIKPDIDEVKHQLYCVKSKVSEGITKTLNPIWEGTTPARNGNYRIAEVFPESPGIHVQDLDCRGTLVFVSSFAGDDRVAPIRTSDLDSRESYNPTPPSLKTKASDLKDGDQYVHADQKDTVITIKDTVNYYELAAGKQYALTATLMDKATGRALLDTDGKEITASKIFTPTHRNGTETIEIPVKWEVIAGKTTVVFEKATREGKEPIIHADINDDDQSIYAPLLRTSATTEAGNRYFSPDQPTVKLTDVVRYQGLKPGETYTIQGYLVNRQDSEPLQRSESKAITFVAHSSGNGQVIVPFTLKTAPLIKSNAWVVYENLHHGSTTEGSVIARHHDINATEQTLIYQPLPTTGTQSVALAGGSLLAIAFGGVTIYRRKQKN